MAINLLSALKSCLGICSRRRNTKKKSPEQIRRNDYFNRRLRTNLGMDPTRPKPRVPNTNTTTNNNSNNIDNHFTTGPPSQPRPLQLRDARGSSTSNYNTIPPPNWTTTPMDTRHLKHLFEILHTTFEQFPYAVVGLAALIDHGLSRRACTRISILTPRECKDTIRSWATVKGCPVEGSSIGLRLPDGSLRRVRIKYVVETGGFERLERVSSRVCPSAGAKVLSVSSQLDNIAAGYLDLRFNDRNKTVDREGLDTVVGDLFFALEGIAARRMRLDPNLLPTFLGEQFFMDFTARYPDSRPEMARAGIDVAAVLKRNRDFAALREHDAMLRQYGVEGLEVVGTQPGPFERMRDLRDCGSVYTLRGDDHDHDHDKIPPPPPPPLPAKTMPPPLRVPEKAFNKRDVGVRPPRPHPPPPPPPPKDEKYAGGHDLTSFAARMGRL